MSEQMSKQHESFSQVRDEFESFLADSNIDNDDIFGFTTLLARLQVAHDTELKQAHKMCDTCDKTQWPPADQDVDRSYIIHKLTHTHIRNDASSHANLSAICHAVYGADFWTPPACEKLRDRLIELIARKQL